MKRILWTTCALLLLAAPARAQTEAALLDTIQHTAFQYFWNEANPTNGLIRDRSQGGSPASIASMGFGLSAICVGIDHGWITRSEGATRVQAALQTMWTAPQGDAVTGTIGYKGLFFHFLKMGVPEREWNSELSTIDTALLLAGIIDAKQYFDQPEGIENSIRVLADSIYYRADWEFMRNFGAGLRMGWRASGDTQPGFTRFGEWVGYNEAMILYILALGSPTHPVPATTWNRWDDGYNFSTQYNLQYLIFPPLFGHQYSHCWIDFRNINDAFMRARGITYFENSRRATLAQKRYAKTNPLNRVGYSDSLWGLTASDTPTGYSARGAPPIQNDDGTITPTAPISSLPFAPDSVMPVIRNLWNNYRGSIWGPYGFRDAFNLTTGLNGNPALAPWIDPDYIGIDQGPIVLMIENYRTGKVWNRFMRNADVHRGLERAGFLPVVAGVGDPAPGGSAVLLAPEPNPFQNATTLRFRLPAAGTVRLTVHDIAGREVGRLIDGIRPAGLNTVSFSGRGLATGVYLVRLASADRTWTQKCLLVR